MCPVHTPTRSALTAAAPIGIFRLPVRVLIAVVFLVVILLLACKAVPVHG